MGSAKHVMQNVWLNVEQPLLADGQLKEIHRKVDEVRFPSTLGWLPNKIAESFKGFTADQWKTWTLVIFIYALKDVLPDAHLEVWGFFVLACQLLCSPYITVSQAAKANLLLKSFCRQFEGLYGAKLVTPNMHMHTHLREFILDFGPVYAFRLFSFERYMVS